MHSIITWLDRNPWSNLVFLILSILGIIVSVFLYFKSKKTKKAVYYLSSTNIISSKMKFHGNIQITYLEEKVENFTVSKISFWNNGNDVINETDLAPTDKLKIVIDDNFEILDADIIFQSKKTNNAKFNKQPKEITINFDYFNPQQGFIIRIIHTGIDSSSLKLYGTIKGGKEVSSVRDDRLTFFHILFVSVPLLGSSVITKRTFIKIQKIVPLLFFVLGLLLLLITMILKLPVESNLLLEVFSGIYIFYGLLTYFTTNKIPKWFEILYEDE